MKVHEILAIYDEHGKPTTDPNKMIEIIKSGRAFKKINRDTAKLMNAADMAGCGGNMVDAPAIIVIEEDGTIRLGDEVETLITVIDNETGKSATKTVTGMKIGAITCQN